VDVQTTETGQVGVTTGYTASSVTLNFSPNSTKVYTGATSGALTTLLVGGVDGATGTYDYSIDSTQKKINATGTFSNWITVQYTYSIPAPINVYSQPSIDAYKIFQKTITYDDVQSVNDAISRGQNYLVQYSTPFLYTTLKVKSSTNLNLAIGQIINVVDNISTPNINKNLVITRYRMRYPSDYDELDVGDKMWRLGQWGSDVETQIKRLNEEIVNQSLTTQLILEDGTALNLCNIQPYYQMRQIQTADGVTLIWYNATQGTWGNYVWGGDAFGALTTNFIQQYQNSYSETFKTTDFEA
jgi:hypothetical protein